MEMTDATVKVPTERLPEFYEMYGRWLASSPDVSTDGGSPDRKPWGEDDVEPATEVWAKLSPFAKGMFGMLIDAPEEKRSGDQLAELLHIPNGRYGVAGVLAWPARHCYAVGRVLPIRWEDSGDGQSWYWMEAPVAAMFAEARTLA